MEILLLEDNPGDARLFHEVLRELDYLAPRVAHARRLSEAVELARRRALDIIFLDLSLPDGYGLEVVRQVRAVTTAPIVVLTGSVDETLAARALTEGAQSYLPKGFIEPAELLAAMETAGAALAPRLSVGANPGVPE